MTQKTTETTNEKNEGAKQMTLINESKIESVDLTLIGYKILQGKKEEFMKMTQGQNVFLNFSMIVKKYSQFEAVKDLPAFRIFKMKKDVGVHTLVVNKLENDFVLSLPDINRTIVDKSEWQLVSIDLRLKLANILYQNIPMTVSLSLSNEGIAYSRSQKTDEIIFIDELDLLWIQEYKVIPVKLASIPKGESFEASYNGKISEEWHTKLICLKSLDNDKVYENVLPNSILEKMLRTKETVKIQIGESTKMKSGMKVEIIELED